MPPTLTGTPRQPLPTNGQFGEASTFTLAIGSNEAVNVNVPQAATTSLSNPADPSDPATLVGQINRATESAGIGPYVQADDEGGNIGLALRKFDLGPTLQIDYASDTGPITTVLGCLHGQIVHAKAGDLFIENATARGSLDAAVANASGAAFATASVGPLEFSVGQGGCPRPAAWNSPSTTANASA